MTLLTSHYHSRFLRTSGQNIDDVEKYSKAKDKLEFMERTLRWRHAAPTAPNALGSEGQWVRLVCVPKFSDSGVAVMVNLKTCTLCFLKVAFFILTLLPQPH